MTRFRAAPLKAQTALALLLALAWLGGCSDHAPSGPDQSAAIRIAALTSGPDMDADGYTVSVDGNTALPLAANGVLSLSGIAPGEHVVELGGVADNCAVIGPNPDSVHIARGATAEVAFVVGCRAVGGSGLVVSDPVPAPAGPQVAVASPLASAELAADSVAYVSLGTGAVPDGRFATVHSLATGLTLRTELLDGGFDPVAVPASPGDSVEVRVTDTAGGTLLQAYVTVLRSRAPVIVRTQPPPRKRDVPLNSVLVVVFSEPVDPATVTGASVRLLRGATAVAGTVRSLDGSGVAAVFEAAELLSPGTDYRLVVTNGIRDLEGEVLEAPVAVAFTTGDALAGAVASVTVSYSLVEGYFPSTTVIRAYVRDASGNDLTGKDVTWASSDSSIAAVSPNGNEAWLTLRAGGVGTITATSEGHADTALVISRPLPPEIATGALQVIAATTGLDPDASGYSVIVDGGPGLPVASNDSITIGGLSVGTHAVALGGVAANCAIADSSGSEANPRSVTVMGGDTVETAFAVACAALTGTLRVIVTTTGDSLDPDGYGVCVGIGDYGRCLAVGLNDTVTFAGLPTGQGAISLNDVAANCAVSGGNNIRRVTVSAGATTDYAFALDCASVTAGGAVEVTTATTGVDPDQDGYGLSVDGGALPYSLSPDGRTVIGPLEAGSHTLLLYLVSSNCRVVGENPRTVTVTAGDTTPVAFDVTCSTAEKIAFDGMWCTPYPPCELYPVIHLMFADGSNLWNLVSYGHEPAWSPTGDRIAFTSDGGDVNVLTLDGGAVVRLTTHSAYDGSPAWSPDGSRIAFASDRDGQPELYLMNPDGSGVVRVTNSVGFVGQPAWSPDGGRIAFDCEVETGNRDVCTVNVDGTGLTRLTNDLAADFDPAWSPDGARLAFATGRYDAFSEIAVMAVDGGAVTRVHAGTSGVQPSWSPDGTRIAFSQNAGSLYVSVMNADGSGLVLLMLGANPAWRPVPPAP